MRKTSDSRFQAFITATLDFYTWEQILNESKIGDVRDKGEQFEMACILHEDKRPSLRLTKATGTYHCFSCGAKGTYTKFMWELRGRPMPYAEFCEQILKSSPVLQQKLGFNTLYVTAQSVDAAFEKRIILSVNDYKQAHMPITVLSNKIKSLDNSWESLVTSLVLLQEGVMPEGVWALIKKQTIITDKPVERVSIADLL